MVATRPRASVRARRFLGGIDTGRREGSVALSIEGAGVASEPLRAGEHSSGLPSAAERLLRAWDAAWGDVAGIAVCGGPGSFTGLRIGLAWAKGLCLGLGRPLVMVSAHEALAHTHRKEDWYIATVLPGERGGIQVRFRRTGRPYVRPEPVLEPVVMPEDRISDAYRLIASATREA